MQADGYAIGLVFLSSTIGSFGALFLKMGADRAAFTVADILLNRMLMLGILFYLVSSLVFIFALTRGELSVLFPIVSFGYVLIALHSKVFLKERIGPYKLAGIGLIILGIVIIGTSL